MVYIPKNLRKLVRERAKYCCEYCKTPEQFNGAISEVDHVTPHSLGGETSLENLAAACRNCNSHKSDS
jgi:5-methylcytosine-specific restriction endonuclease McrA